MRYECRYQAQPEAAVTDWGASNPSTGIRARQLGRLVRMESYDAPARTVGFHLIRGFYE